MDFNKLTLKSQEAVAAAQELARRMGNPELYPEHLLLALLDQELPQQLVPDAAALRAQAEATLCGLSHRQRIVQLHRVLPGHALQLERARRHAALRVRHLRVRVEFVRHGYGLPKSSTGADDDARTSLLRLQ
jgi:ATP-dependent Clp protease ATP-binding subunit ClpA